MTSVREKYRDCQVKPTTTSFAVYSRGTIYLLDSAANQMARDQFASSAAASADPSTGSGFMMVTVKGSAEADRLTGVTSIQRQPRGNP
ncbi:MAG TPA: hypothetical protein VFL57_01485 [Bryobacteraceae bacterium]|nr:hypothetical protein [Bryobacteraceae bacterium]